MSDQDANVIVALLIFGTASVCLIALTIGAAVRIARRKP